MKTTWDHGSVSQSDHGKSCIMALGPLMWRDDMRFSEVKPSPI